MKRGRRDRGNPCLQADMFGFSRHETWCLNRTILRPITALLFYQTEIERTKTATYIVVVPFFNRILEEMGLQSPIFSSARVLQRDTKVNVLPGNNFHGIFLIERLIEGSFRRFLIRDSENRIYAFYPHSLCLVIINYNFPQTRCWFIGADRGGKVFYNAFRPFHKSFWSIGTETQRIDRLTICLRGF